MGYAIVGAVSEGDWDIKFGCLPSHHNEKLKVPT